MKKETQFPTSFDMLLTSLIKLRLLQEKPKKSENDSKQNSFSGLQEMGLWLWKDEKRATNLSFLIKKKTCSIEEKKNVKSLIFTWHFWKSLNQKTEPSHIKKIDANLLRKILEKKSKKTSM